MGDRTTLAAEVSIVGTGAAGFAAALCFAQAGFDTILIGPEPSVRDGRTAALMLRSWALLERIGAAARLRPEAGALRRLTIADDTDNLFRPPPVTFEADEIGQEVFGWNLENGRLVEALAGIAADTPGLRWIQDVATGFDGLGDRARITLGQGGSIEARLAVAADGRRSRLREEAGIGVRETPYPQTAFTTILLHEREHGDTSTELHKRTGPFTMVPLPGRRSSLVWVTIPAHARRLLQASDADLAEAVYVGSRGLLGRVQPDGPRGLAPLSTLLARQLVAPRLALIGEAAHALPPIGAQGLNLGLADVEALIEAAETARRTGGDPGGLQELDRYATARGRDLKVRAAAVDALNRSLLTPLLPVDAARGLGLGLLGEFGALRRTVMRVGLGAGEARARA